jgi:RNA polymerase sigma factor (TIGR02999 family)
MSAGDSQAVHNLLPLLYSELKRMAAARMEAERQDHTLQATALVHEAYLRLVGGGDQPGAWENRRHFLSAAAEAMRRILIENARRKMTAKRGGGCRKLPLGEELLSLEQDPARVLEVNELLERLAVVDPAAAEIVTLRFFGGLTIKESSEAMGISPRSANLLWAYSRAWLIVHLDQEKERP